MDDLTQRLHDLGTHPVPSDARADHLTRMADASPAASPHRFGRLAVAAAAIVGFLAGSTGLAMAGALPDPAQDVAHDVLSVVRVDVPEGTRGQCVSAAARDAALTKDEKRAAKDQCPKGGPPAGIGGSDDDGAPGRSGTAPGRAKPDKHADDPCRGRPPWAGAKDLTPAERADLQAERTALCGPDDDADDADIEVDDTAEDTAEDQPTEDQPAG